MKRVKLAFRLELELMVPALTVDGSVKLQRALKRELWEAFHRAREEVELELGASVVYAAVVKEKEEYEEVGESNDAGQ